MQSVSITNKVLILLMENHIGGIMVRVLALSAVDHGFEPRTVKTKNYKIGICCFSAKYTALRRRTGWLGIRIMCLGGAICLSINCSFSAIAL
jgi:hypothetical protein